MSATLSEGCKAPGRGPPIWVDWSAVLAAAGRVLLLGATGLACCTGPQVRLPEGGPTDGTELLARALAQPMPQTVQGMARMDSYQKGAARKADLLLIVRQPNQAQFQVLSPTLDLLGLMSTDGEAFVSFERGGERCYSGAACPENLARIVPMALPPDQLTQALLGRPPILVSSLKSLAWDAARGVYRLDIGEAKGHHQEVFVHPTTFRFLATVLYEAGERLASLAYEGEVGPNGPPRMLRFIDTRHDLDLSITLRDVDVNEPVDDAVFRITCPAGMAVQNLPCDATPDRSAP